MSAKGAVIDGRTVCFLPAEEIEKVNVGNEAMVGGRPMQQGKASGMAPSVKFTKEEVGEAAMRITRANGIGSLTARSLAFEPACR